MNWLGRFFKFYINASFQVAFSVLALVYVTALHFEVETNTHLAWGLFFASVACYNFVKYGVEAEKYVLMSSKIGIQIQALSLLALALSIYHFYFLTLQIWIGILVLSLSSVLYSLPLLPEAKNLRNLGSFKIFVVAFVWAGVTVVLPLMDTGVNPGWDFGVEFVQRFLLVIILILPFEIRDLNYDPPELRTLPQRFGIKTTKKIGVVLVTCVFFASFLKDQVSRIEITTNIGICLTLYGLLWATKKKQSTYFASFWVESVPILWWLSLVLLMEVLNLTL